MKVTAEQLERIKRRGGKVVRESPKPEPEQRAQPMPVIDREATNKLSSVAALQARAAEAMMAAAQTMSMRDDGLDRLLQDLTRQAQQTAKRGETVIQFEGEIIERDSRGYMKKFKITGKRA